MRASGTLRIGRLAGIPIGIHPLWLVIVALITWSLGHSYYPGQIEHLSVTAGYLLGLASALLLFLGILLHELGHAIVARRHGVEIEEIDLWLLGGVARMRGEPRHADDELRFALAGPAVTLVFAAGFGGARLLVGSPDWLRALLDYQVYVNVAILVFNLLPAFPLDGGRVMRALLWRHSGDMSRATLRAALIGRAFGWALAALGLLSFVSGAVTGLWLALLGGFLIVASSAEAQASTTAQALKRYRVRDLMTSPAVTLPAELTLDRAVGEHFARHLYTAYPVVDEAGAASGLLSIDLVRSIPARSWPDHHVGDVLDDDPGLLVSPDMPVNELFTTATFRRTGRVAVVGPSGEVLGILSITDLQRTLRSAELAVAGR